MKSNTEKSKVSNKTIRIAETALMIALAGVLAAVAVIPFPFGGSVTLFSQVPIIIIAYRYGTKWGLVSGFTLSLIQIILGLDNFAYVKGFGAYCVLVLADYIIPYTALGLGGIFKKKLKIVPALALGSILVSSIRFVCHFITGVTIWSGYAPSSALSAIIKYSLGYNASYMLPEMAVTIIGACIIGRFFDIEKERLI